MSKPLQLSDTQLTMDRLKTIEARGALEYLGVWQRAASYQRGNLVTCDGGTWCACRDTAAEKPDASDAWQLILKLAARPPAFPASVAHPRGSTPEAFIND